MRRPGGGARGQGQRDLPPEKRFSESRALQLCQLAEGIERQQPEPDVAEAADVLRSLAEVLVYNDKFNELIVDKVLMERDLMMTLERLVTNAMLPTEVKVSVLQCVTMLLQNLTRVSSVYFLCSNNRINRMIAIPLDEDDDELVSVYTSFLKSLALRLNKDTVQFFYEADERAFPLFDKAVKMMSSTDDAMVRAATRQIIVCIAQIDDSGVQSFLAGALLEVYEIVLTAVVELLQASTRLIPWMGGDGILSVHSVEPRAIVVLFEDIMDLVLYLNDLYKTANSVTDDAQLKALVERVLLEPIVECLEGCLAGDAAREGGSTHGGGSLSAVPPPALVGFVARWAEENEIPIVLSSLQETFHASHADWAAEGASLHDRLSVGQTSLAHSLALLNSALCQGLQRQTPTAGEAHAAVLPIYATVPPRGQYLDDCLPLQCHDRLNGCGGSSARALASLLYRQVTSGGRDGTLLSFVSVLQQCAAQLSASDFVHLRATTVRLVVAYLREMTLSAHAERLAADPAATVGDGDGDSDSEEWHDAYWLARGLNVRDPHLTLFMQLQTARRFYMHGGARVEVMAGYDAKSIAPFLPLLQDHSNVETGEVYLQLQEQLCNLLPPTQRAAAGVVERERLLFHMLFVLLDDDVCGGRLAHCRSDPEEDMLSALDDTLCTRGPRDSDAPAHSWACEVVGGQFGGDDDSASPLAGGWRPDVPLLLTVAADGQVSLSGRDATALGGLSHGGLLAWAASAAYTRAAILPAPASYRALLQGYQPGEEVELHIVFVNATRAAEAVTRINTLAIEGRKRMAEVCRCFLGE